MSCMKCGRDLEEGKVFCDECLEVMKQYPVKPGIAIQLPRREETAALKKSVVKRKAVISLEDQVRILKRRLRGMVVIWLVTLLLLAATIYPTVVFIRELDFVLPGQNYTAINQTETTEH